MVAKNLKEELLFQGHQVIRDIKNPASSNLKKRTEGSLGQLPL